MTHSFTNRIAKLNKLKHKLRLDSTTLLTYIDSGISLHELELVLASEDSIYSSLENVEAIEKAIAKAQAGNIGKPAATTQNSSSKNLLTASQWRLTNFKTSNKGIS